MMNDTEPGILTYMIEPAENLVPLIEESNELISIVVTSIATAKRNREQQEP